MNRFLLGVTAATLAVMLTGCGSTDGSTDASADDSGAGYSFNEMDGALTNCKSQILETEEDVDLDSCLQQELPKMSTDEITNFDIYFEQACRADQADELCDATFDSSASDSSDEPAEEVDPVQEALDAMTAGQSNAVESAMSYIDMSGYSRSGLSQQLIQGEQFGAADVEFAIAFLEKNGAVDWRAEAVESAKDYLDMSSYSRQGLIDQLVSGEGFSQANAEYAVTQAGL